MTINVKLQTALFYIAKTFFYQGWVTGDLLY